MRAVTRARIEGSDERCGMRPHDREQRFDRLQHAGDAAKGQRCGTEPDHLLIIGRAIAPHDVHGIGRRVGVIECPIEIVQPRAQDFDASGARAGRAPGAISGTA
jgi:hypothetical protein